MLPVVREDETYSYVRKDCQHLIAHPLNQPQWNEDFFAAFWADMTSRLRNLGADVERIKEDQLERVRPPCEGIIRKHIKEVDGFFFRNNIADLNKATEELRPILIGLQTAGS